MPVPPAQPTAQTSEATTFAGARWHRTSYATNGGGDTRFLYDGDNVLADFVEDTQNPGSYIASKVYVTPFVDDNLSMTVLSGEQAGTYYYTGDRRHSVVTLTDSSGAMKNCYDLTAMGERLPGTHESIVQRYEYTGRELASQSGDYYFRYRVYDPALGQFFTRDPLGYADGLGLYQGVYSLHLRRDPFGGECLDTPEQSSTCRTCCVVSFEVDAKARLVNMAIPHATAAYWEFSYFAIFGEDTNIFGMQQDPACCEFRQRIISVSSINGVADEGNTAAWQYEAYSRADEPEAYRGNIYESSDQPGYDLEAGLEKGDVIDDHLELDWQIWNTCSRPPTLEARLYSGPLEMKGTFPRIKFHVPGGRLHWRWR